VDASFENREALPPDRLNYFNYFTEVEEEFVRRRGKHLRISSLDWALVESWKDAGIPLYIVLRGINRSFDAYDARPRKFDRVNTLSYCEQAIETTYAEYRLSQVGASTADPAASSGAAGHHAAAPSFTKESLLEFIDRCDAGLARAGRHLSAPPVAGDQPEGTHDTESRSSAQATDATVSDATARAQNRLQEIKNGLEQAHDVDPEGLERDLDAIDRMILDSLRVACDAEELKMIKKEAASHLKKYRKKMEKSIYDQTIENFIARRLRETFRIPRLSLFFL
jgi:hypothetical protein